MNGNDEEQKQITFSIELYFRQYYENATSVPFVTEKIWQSLPHEGDTIVKLHGQKCVNH